MNVLLNGGKAKLIGQRPGKLPEAEEESEGEQLPDDRTYDPAFFSTESVPRTPLKEAHLLGCARSHRAKELFKPFNTFKQFKTVKNTNTLQLNPGGERYWSDAFKPNAPLLQSSSFVSLYLGKRRLEWSQIPEVIHLEILAFDRAGETVEL